MKRVVVAASFILLPSFALAQEDRDPGLLAGLIESGLSGAGRIVQIDGFRGLLFSTSQIERLTIADDSGPWLIAEDLVLDWNRSALFGGRLDVNRLTAERFTLLRAPIAAPDEGLRLEDLPSAQSTPFALPELPLSIKIDELGIASLILGESFIGKELELTLSGAANLANGEGEARIEAEALRGTQGALRLAGSYSNTSRILALDLALHEEADGLVAGLLSIPETPSVDFTLQGTGPIDGYRADLTLATDGQARLTGFGAVTQAQGAQSFALGLEGDLTAVIAPVYHDFFGAASKLELQGERRADGTLSLSQLAIDTEALALSGTAELDGALWPRAFALSGTLAQKDGRAVVLPSSNGALLSRADLDLSFDAQKGDRWQIDTTLQGFSAQGFSLPELSLQGGGVIQAPSDASETGVFTADLRYEAAQMLTPDPDLTKLLGAGLSGEITLERAREGLVLERFTLTSGADLQAALTGLVQSDLTFSGDLALRSGDLSRLSGLAGLPLAGTLDAKANALLSPAEGRYSLTLDGEAGDLALGIAQIDPYFEGRTRLETRLSRDPLGTRLEGLNLQSPHLFAQGDIDLTSESLNADLDFEIKELARGFEGLEGPARVTLTAERRPEAPLVLDLSYTDAQIAPGDLRLRAVPQADGRSALTVQAKVAQIAPYAQAFAGLAASGALTLTGEGTLAHDFAQFDFKFDGDAQDITLQNPALDPLLAGRIALSGAVTRSDAETLNLSRLSLRLPALGATARAEGQLTALSEAPKVSGQIALSDLRLTPLSALAQRRLGGIVQDLTLVVKDLDLQGSALAGTLTARGQDLGFSTPYDPLFKGLSQITADLTFADLANFSIDGQLATPQGEVTLKGGLQDFVGSVDLNAGLRNLALILPDLRGEGRLIGTLKGEGKGRLSLEAELSDPVSRGSLSLRSVPEAEPKALPETYSLALSADLTDLRHYTPLVGQPIAGALRNVQINGTLSPLAGLFDLTVKGQSANLAAGPQIARTLLAGTGQIDARLRRAERQGQTLFALEDVALAFPNFDLKGGLDSASRATYTGRLKDVGLILPDYRGPLDVTGTAQLGAGGRWGLEANLTAPGEATAKLSGTATPAQNSYDLNLDAKLPLAYANPFLDPTRASGTADLNLTLRGAPALENLSGTIVLRNGRVAVPALQTPISDLTGTITLANGRATLQGVSARASSEPRDGALLASGSVGLTAPFPADLTFRIDRPLTARSSLLFETGVSSPGVTLRGPLLGRARIDGVINLTETEVRVPTSGVGALGDLPNVYHISPSVPVATTIRNAGLSAQGTAPQRGATSASVDYDINLTIKALDNIFIRGRGLDAELAGEIRVAGSTAQLRPEGEFNLVRGRLSILQQRFELTEGRISLGGDFNPVILLEAQTKARTGTDVTVALSGSLAALDVTFSSQPELPQDEVLAQLIFGRDLSSITPLQAVQLAAAVGELAGRGGGVMESLRSGAGLQDLEVLQDADGNAALRLGKALSDRVYTDVTVGTGDTEVNLNLDLNSDFTLKATVGSRGDTRFGVFFERDYD